MRKLRIILFIFCLFIFCNTASASREKVSFSKCVDGDTIKVLINKKEVTVRFLAVDTPESVHPTKGVEYYGKEASSYTCNLVSNANTLELEYDSGSDKTDKYNRVLAWVWVDNVLLQDELVKNGYAEVAYLYVKYKYTDTLKDHQSVAESSKIGIWNDKAREEFNSGSNNSSTSYNDNSEDEETFDFKNMSIKEIIIFIVIMAIVSIFTPYIKKIKRKVNKLLK